MSKPDDIPQNVWDYAKAVEAVWRDLPPEQAVEHHARAIMAETEACAALIDCDCSMSCELKTSAETIRARLKP